MNNIPLVARIHDRKTTFPLGEITVGADLLLIAGPCGVETEEQMISIARAVKQSGAHLLRGGAFKPRTSPYSFQGLGLEGVKLLKQAGQLVGLPVVTEVMDTRDVTWVSKFVDVLQIGARNMQNFSLLKEVGRVGKPVILKRGMNATLEEWLNCAEYILKGGNHQVILCERGIRTFETYTRNTVDLSAVPALRELTHLPVIVDPSHGTGRLSLIRPMSLAATACGADGLMIEVHSNPADALSDKDQSLTPAEFTELARQAQTMATFVRGACPESAAGGTDLEGFRHQINQVDTTILELLANRMELARQCRQFKSSVTDTQREADVFQRVISGSEGRLSPEFCRSLFSQIITESKRIQEAPEHQLSPGPSLVNSTLGAAGKAIENQGEMRS